MIPLITYDFEANIHLYQYQDLNIMVDVNSGAVHVLDDMTYDLIQKTVQFHGDMYRAMEYYSSKYPLDNLQEAVMEILGLYENGAIFSDEEIFDLDFSNMPIKAICLNVAHVCNMSCKYCFASQGDFGGKPSLMDLEIGKKTIDFLINNSDGVKNLEVDFFGGEPLLNFNVVKSIVEYGRKRGADTGKNINFTLTTNALLLDEEIMDFIINNDISIILSLDGRPEVNDLHRTSKTGHGTYDQILPKIKQIISKNPISYYARGTFTNKNLDFVNDIKHIVDELGINYLSLEPAVGKDNPFSISTEQLPRVLEEYDNLTNYLLEAQTQSKHIHFFHYNLNLQKGPCIAKRNSGCGAGIEYIAVTPEGDIYPCHQFIGNNDLFMGNVLIGEVDQKVRKVFETNHLHKENCGKCWARYYCGGGCHANALDNMGTIHIPHETGCIMHKKRIEGAIYLEIIQSLKTKD